MVTDIHLYGIPKCHACQSWRAWLEMEGMEFEEHSLDDVHYAVLRCPELLREISEGDMKGEHGPFAPVVVRVHGDGKVGLIAHGTEPLFAMPNKEKCHEA